MINLPKIRSGAAILGCTATLAIGGMAAAAPAIASTTPDTSVFNSELPTENRLFTVSQQGPTHTLPEATARAGWHLIWGPGKHTPTKYWPTPDFVPRSSVLGVNFRCWGNDGTTIKADIVRTRDKKTVQYGLKHECDGNWKELDYRSARIGTAYYMRIYLSRPHTIEAKAYYYK